MQCAVTYAADGTPDGTCTTADCVFAEGASAYDMMAALMATTEGAAMMACQNPPEPCSNDASRDSGAIITACIAAADCMAIIGADDFAAGDEPTQAEVLASGCGANTECCAIVTCRTVHSCTGGANPAPAPEPQVTQPDCEGESGACMAAPACLAALMSGQPSCGAAPVSRYVNAPPSLPRSPCRSALTDWVSRAPCSVVWPTTQMAPQMAPAQVATPVFTLQERVT